MKRHITPKVIVRMILAYLFLVIIDMIIFFIIDELIQYIYNDPCLYYFDYKKYRWVLNRTYWKLYVLALKFRYYVPLILTTVPSAIVFVMLVLETIAFAVVLKRGADLGKLFITEKDLIDSANFTRLTLCMFAVCIKHVFTYGPTMAIELAFGFNLQFKLVVYFQCCANVGDILLAINYSTNIFLYLVINSKFRTEFRNIFLLNAQNKLGSLRTGQIW